MLLELADETDNLGMKMSKSKANLMVETDTPIYVNNTQIENVESYIYLGRRYSTSYKNQEKEFQRRITAGWTALAKHLEIFKGNIGSRLHASSNDIRRENMGTHQPCNGQASSCVNKYVKECVKHHIPVQKKQTYG